MPRWDGTGPRGMGAMSGKGMGYCRRDGYIGRRTGYGRGYRPRYGRGIGRFGAWGAYPFSSEEEKISLEEEKGYLEARLEEIGQTLEEFTEE